MLENLSLFNIIEILHSLESSLSLRAFVKVVVDVDQDGCDRWQMNSSCLGSIMHHVQCTAGQEDLWLHLFDICIHPLVLSSHDRRIITTQAQTVDPWNSAVHQFLFYETIDVFTCEQTNNTHTDTHTEHILYSEFHMKHPNIVKAI